MYQKSHGDVILVLRSETDEDFRLRCEVSSQLMSSVSPVFQKLFGPNLKEGRLLRESSGSEILPEIVMEEPNPRAMWFICKALHHQLGKSDNPRSRGITLSEIAVQVDKYDLSQALETHLSSWLSDMIDHHVSLTEVISILPLLQDTDDVSRIGRYVVVNATPANFVEWRANEYTSMVSLSLIDEFSSQSNALRATLTDLIYTHTQAAGDRPEHCFHYVRCNRCKEWVGLQQEFSLYGDYEKNHTCHSIYLAARQRLCTRQLRKDALSKALSKGDLLPLCNKTQDLSASQIYEKVRKLDPRGIYECGETGTPHRCPLYESMDALAAKMKECIGHTKICSQERDAIAGENPEGAVDNSEEPGSRFVNIFKRCLLL